VSNSKINTDRPIHSMGGREPAEPLHFSRIFSDCFLSAQPAHPVGLWYSARCALRLNSQCLSDVL